MTNITWKHDSEIIKNPALSTTKTCNCNRKTDSPMDGNCLSECLINKGTVSTTANTFRYSTCENTFKERYNNHNYSFRNKSREKNTKLNKKDINYFINWNIALKSEKYVCGSRKCDLCICKKLLISKADSNALLNKREELVSKYRHRNKLTLFER